MQSVTVRAPASTSNLGPGFDCLGLALRLYNDVTVQTGGAPSLAPMMQKAGDRFFAQTKRKPIPFSCQVSGDVPVARGLGSSVTVRLGVLHGLNELAGRPLSRDDIFSLCSELEGHPDNAAPGEFGGFNIVSGIRRQRFPVAATLKFILLVPDFEVQTAEARALLPKQIERIGAVESCANACAITAAFASGDYAQLHGAFGDHLHQPYRKRMLPFFDQAVFAAERAGALGSFISGSGSAIAAVTFVAPEKIAAALQAVVPTARVIVTTADNRGARIIPVSLKA
ncbi:MAG: homoserine kinase [Chthoniobacterales bacterium]